MKTKFFLLVAGLLIVVNLLSWNPGQQYTDRMNYRSMDLLPVLYSSPVFFTQMYLKPFKIIHNL